MVLGAAGLDNRNSPWICLLSRAPEAPCFQVEPLSDEAPHLSEALEQSLGMWHTPVNPNMWKASAGGVHVQDQPGPRNEAIPLKGMIPLKERSDPREDSDNVNDL